MPSERRPARPGICNALAEEDKTIWLEAYGKAGKFTTDRHDSTVLLREVLVKGTFEARFHLVRPRHIEEAAGQRDARGARKAVAMVSIGEKVGF